jgi:heat shock protein HslJ
MKTSTRTTALIIGLLVAIALIGGIAYAGLAIQTSTADEPKDVTTIFVGPELKDCEGMGPMKCLQIADSADGPWSNWYGEIEGFIHQPGLLSELKVRRIEVLNPPADGSSLRLVLVAIVSQSSFTLTQPSLDGTSWDLVSIDGAAAVAGGSKANLAFAGSQISGSSGCNGFFGSYTVGEATLSFSQVGSTMMACSPELNDQEFAFFAALEAAESYTIEGDTLTISFGGGKPMVFSAA